MYKCPLVALFQVGRDLRWKEKTDEGHLFLNKTFPSALSIKKNCAPKCALAEHDIINISFFKSIRTYVFDNSAIF